MLITEFEMIHLRTFDNGLTLIIEPISSVASCSMQWLVPAGTSHEPDSRVGITSVLAEMLFRGAGKRDSRTLSDDMDRIGLGRDCGVSGPHSWFMGTVLGNFIEPAMELASDILLRPALPAEGLEASRSLCQQAIDSLEDEPQQEAMLYVQRRHRPVPFNRSSYGMMDVVQSVTREELAAFCQMHFVPEGSILGLAGDVDPDAVTTLVERLVSSWSGSCPEPVAQGSPLAGKGHVQRESAQVHVAMAWEAPPAGSKTAILERLATRILGGATSGRLFTEVRQRRSLCYSVSATYRARRDVGEISLYAGTTPERASETLDVCLTEIDRMQEGISEEEFDRAMVGLRGSTVFNGERTQARAAALVGDFYALGRVRSMEDRLEELANVSLEDVNAYLRDRARPEPTIVTVGREALAADFETEPPLCSPGTPSSDA